MVTQRLKVTHIAIQCSACCRDHLGVHHPAFRESYVCISPSLHGCTLLIAHSRLCKVPSRFILQSFVSSHRSDGFRCASLADHTFVTPPYACAYSYGKRIQRVDRKSRPCCRIGAKGCGTPLLAVATEEGSVSVLDTSRRREWDFGTLIYNSPMPVLYYHP